MVWVMFPDSLECQAVIGAGVRQPSSLQVSKQETEDIARSLGLNVDEFAGRYVQVCCCTLKKLICMSLLCDAKGNLS